MEKVGRKMGLFVGLYLQKLLSVNSSCNLCCILPHILSAHSWKCLFSLHFQQVSYVGNESYKTVEQVTNNLQGKKKEVTPRQQNLTVAMWFPPWSHVRPISKPISSVCIRHRVSAGIGDPESFQRNPLQSVVLRYTSESRYDLPACSVLHHCDHVRACEQSGNLQSQDQFFLTRAVYNFTSIYRFCNLYRFFLSCYMTLIWDFTRNWEIEGVFSQPFTQSDFLWNQKRCPSEFWPKAHPHRLHWRTF